MNKRIELASMLGVFFMFVQYVEFSGCEFGMDSGFFGSAFFGLTRFHGFHVVVRMLLLIIALSRFYGNQLGLKGVGVDTSICY